MAAPRESHTATLLPNGQALVTGGHVGRRQAITIHRSAELCDPQSGSFAPTGNLVVRRHKHEATLLADGRVLISGGSDERDEQGVYRSTELYDPAGGRFAPAGELLYARYKHTGASLLLADGSVLLLGGASRAERFDPQASESLPVAGGVGATRLFATVTALGGGEILVAGGYGPDTRSSERAWLLLPTKEAAGHSRHTLPLSLGN